MEPESHSRRTFLGALGLGAAGLTLGPAPAGEEGAAPSSVDPSFLIRREELVLDLRRGDGARRLSFSKHEADPARWKADCRKKLAELLGTSGSDPTPAPVKEVRSETFSKVRYRALVMKAGEGLSIPAYLLEPLEKAKPLGAVLAIQGHGEVEPVIGTADDYHHAFGLELARAGYAVLCPALRGFGVLRDLAWGSGGARALDYWEWGRGAQFTLVTDGFLHGKTLIGETVEDLLRWERWLAESAGFEKLDVAGISYGGDLAVTYPAFSSRVRKIFASGTLGSFSVVFSRCYNAPAHCIPGVLEWMDRSDIAGLNAPRPILLHYGELDVPGPKNNSASYNETVEPSIRELRAIYRAFGAGSASGPPPVRLVVTPGRGHEMDNRALLEFLAS